MGAIPAARLYHTKYRELPPPPGGACTVDYNQTEVIEYKTWNTNQVRRIFLFNDFEIYLASTFMKRYYSDKIGQLNVSVVKDSARLQFVKGVVQLQRCLHLNFL